MAPKFSIPLPSVLQTCSSNAQKHPGLLKGLLLDPEERPPAPPSSSAEEKKDKKEQKAAEARMKLYIKKRRKVELLQLRMLYHVRMSTVNLLLTTHQPVTMPQFQWWY